MWPCTYSAAQTCSELVICRAPNAPARFGPDSKETDQTRRCILDQGLELLIQLPVPTDNVDASWVTRQRKWIRPWSSASCLDWVRSVRCMTFSRSAIVPCGLGHRVTGDGDAGLRDPHRWRSVQEPSESAATNDCGRWPRGRAGRRRFSAGWAARLRGAAAVIRRRSGAHDRDVPRVRCNS